MRDVQEGVDRLGERFVQRKHMRAHGRTHILRGEERTRMGRLRRALDRCWRRQWRRTAEVLRTGSCTRGRRQVLHRSGGQWRRWLAGNGRRQLRRRILARRRRRLSHALIQDFALVGEADGLIAKQPNRQRARGHRVRRRDVLSTRLKALTKGY